VMYHGVHSRQAANFESQLRFLIQYFEVVALEEIVSQALGNSRRRVGLVALTFDDGLRNNYTIAYPILRSLGLPATFYVCPGMIGGPRSLWTYEVRTRLARVKPEDRKKFSEWASYQGGNDIDAIVAWMKSIPVPVRERVEEEIRGLTPDFRFSEEEHERFDLMNWAELAALDPTIATIGSHGLSHADLTQVDPDRLEEELSASRRTLEVRLGRPICHFSYPNGSYNETVLRQVRKSYQSAVTVNWGGIGPGDDAFTLKRIETDFDLPSFAWRLARHAGR
jgi:peptidoglycan/xylan/chitin deacetylase (PgdA/CDA1 family)